MNAKKAGSYVAKIIRKQSKSDLHHSGRIKGQYYLKLIPSGTGNSTSTTIHVVIMVKVFSQYIFLSVDRRFWYSLNLQHRHRLIYAQATRVKGTSYWTYLAVRKYLATFMKLSNASKMELSMIQDGKIVHVTSVELN